MAAIRPSIALTLIVGSPLVAGTESANRFLEGSETARAAEQSLVNAPAAESAASDVRMDRTAPTPRASAILAKLDEAQRRNALIELEPTTRPSATLALRSGNEVVALWNQGRHEQALLELERLECGGSEFVPAIT